MFTRSKFSLSVVGMLVIITLALMISGMIDLRITILTAPDADDIVRAYGERMPRWVFIMNHVARDQLNPLSFFLLQQSTTVLYASLYVIAGLAGGIGSYWLEVAGIRTPSPHQHAGTAPRLVLAAFAGGMIFFLVRLPAPLLSKLFSTDISSTVSETKGIVAYESFIALALMAGLFAAVFYDNVESYFRAILQRGEK